MNGLWIAHFESGPAYGSGIAVLRGGEILGGDFSRTWTGTYEVEGTKLYARIQVSPHRLGDQPEPVLPGKAVMMTLAGLHTDNEATLSGHSDDDGALVTIAMHRAN